MTVALWIIAICEVIRALQNMVPIIATKHDLSQRDNLYAEFIKSFKQDDKQFVRNLLEEFEKQEHDPAVDGSLEQWTAGEEPKFE